MIGNFFAKILGNSTTAKLEKICDEAYANLDDLQKESFDDELFTKLEPDSRPNIPTKSREYEFLLEEGVDDSKENDFLSQKSKELNLANKSKVGDEKHLLEGEDREVNDQKKEIEDKSTIQHIRKNLFRQTVFIGGKTIIYEAKRLTNDQLSGDGRRIVYGEYPEKGVFEDGNFIQK